MTTTSYSHRDLWPRYVWLQVCDTHESAHQCMPHTIAWYDWLFNRWGPSSPPHPDRVHPGMIYIDGLYIQYSDCMRCNLYLIPGYFHSCCFLVTRIQTFSWDNNNVKWLFLYDDWLIDGTIINNGSSSPTGQNLSQYYIASIFEEDRRASQCS